MAPRVSKKVLKLSLVISLFAQCTLYSQYTNDQSFVKPDSSEYLWSIEEEPEEASTKNVRKIVEAAVGLPAVPSAAAKESQEARDFDADWDFFTPDEDGDVTTFFPVSNEDEDEESCQLDSFCTQKPEEENQADKPASGGPQKDPALLFPIEEQDGEDSLSISRETLRQSVEPPKNKTAYFDEDSQEWIVVEPAPRKKADLSEVKSVNTAVFTEEKPSTKVKIDVKALEAPAAIVETDSGLHQENSLGKKRVAVPPYGFSVESQSVNKEKRQEASAANSGLVGPLPQTSKTSTKDLASEVQDDKSQVIAQAEGTDAPFPSVGGPVKTPPQAIFINFNNISIIEYIRFISRVTNRNFTFDENDLQFNVTIISEEPTTIDNVITALIQELRIHGLQLIEEDNSFIIHRNPKVKALSPVSANGVPKRDESDTEIITQVFRLNTLSPHQAQNILRPMLSDDAILGVAEESRHIILTDLVRNVTQAENLLKSIDAPKSGLVLGQYVVRNAFMDNLIELARTIMDPIAQGQSLTFVPHTAAKSIFVVSSPFIVERTLSVLQHLDNFQGTTRIFDLEDLKFDQIAPPMTRPTLTPTPTTPSGLPHEPSPTPRPGVPLPDRQPVEPGRWESHPDGTWLFRPGYPKDTTLSPEEFPHGIWQLDPQGQWYFAPEGALVPFRKDVVPLHVPGEVPRGRWALDPQGVWVFQLSPGEDLKPKRLARISRIEEELPIGHVDRTKFYIYKLQYRRGQDIVTALSGIASSLQSKEGVNQDLIVAILSAQWLETSNSIIITGTESAIAKVEELIAEIDTPPRQVLVEMLVLETTIDDSLTYGVSWATKSGGGNTATAQAFIGGATPLVSAFNTTGIDAGQVLTPSLSNLIGPIGYSLGIIGQRLTHNGTQFASLGAVVQAIHTRADTNIVINPKIITEDNKTAEIFVGINSPFLSNSIANDEGNIITSNVEFRDTGVTLRVTPLIGYGDIITLEIEQEVSRRGTTPTAGDETIDPVLIPTTSINRTTTTIHVPDKHFVVLSGMIQEEKTETLTQFPCLGGIPIIGSGFKNDLKTDNKRNLMLFIRPEIIRTSPQFLDITKQQQQMFKQKSRVKKSWKYEVDEALDFMNIRPSCCDDCD